MQWHIELLGGLRLAALGGGATAPPPITHFESHKTAALLAFLALHPERVHPREELCAFLWPDAELSVGRNRLKQALASLRRMMEPPGVPHGSILAADRFALRLCPDSFESDVRAFDRAVRTGQWQQARELWRGELLSGFYEEPILLERERLNALYGRVQQMTNRLLPEAFASNEEQAPAFHSPVRHWLPVPPTPFFGREEELSRLALLLAEKRWITLTGPGGMGKTRLALEAARRFSEETVRFVGLAEMHEETDLPEAIARTLELFPFAASGDRWEALMQALSGGSFGDSPFLLLIDNAEHLVSSHLAERLRRLSDVPSLRLLMTSRVPLGSVAETVFAVGAMPTPAEDATPETLSQNPVLQMFLDRARGVRADMQVTPRNAHALHAICRHLEGIPLAIELCAASAHALAPAQIVERLSSGSAFLVSTRRDTIERHRSLDGALFSTFSLLSPPQRQLMADLTVFRGGGTVEMAEHLCPTAQTLSDLTALTEAGLLQTQHRDAAFFFTMLDTIGRFAARFQSSEEETRAVENRHTRFFQEMAQNFATHRDAEEAAALEAIDAVLDNLRAVVSRALAGKDYGTVLQMVVWLDGYWQMRGCGREVSGWLETALHPDEVPAPQTSLRVAALALCGSLYIGQGEYHRAEAVLQVALHQADGSGKTLHKAQVLYHLGRLAYLRGNLEESRQHHETALALRQSLIDLPSATVSIARSYHVLGQIAQKQKDWKRLRFGIKKRWHGHGKPTAEALFPTFCTTPLF